MEDVENLRVWMGGQAGKPAPTGLRSLSGMPVQRQILCVGADRRVRPHENARLLWMTDAEQMSKSLCSVGAATPSRDNELLIGLSIRSRGRCLALVPKSPVHTGSIFVG